MRHSGSKKAGTRGTSQNLSDHASAAAKWKLTAPHGVARMRSASG